MTQIPYFYIIQHIPTGKLYAGSKWSSNSYPDNFMQPGGYHTSSKRVKSLIKIDGLESFKIIQLMPEDCCGIDVYTYESRFLQNYNVAQRPNWLNCHNNEYVVPGQARGMSWWNNGEIERKVLKTDKPDSGWVRGRLPVQSGRKAYTDGISMFYLFEEPKDPNIKRGRLSSVAKRTGSTQKNRKSYNDGVNEFFIGELDTPEPHWVPGKLQSSKNKMSLSQTGWTWWNDGTNKFSLPPGKSPEPHWKKGMGKRVKP